MDLLETNASHDLCREISARSRGVCLLAFSRGRDSVAAWIQLRRHFERIVPFHCASVPHLGFVDRSLDYYEWFFGIAIERYLNGDSIDLWLRELYQPYPDEARDAIFGSVRWHTEDIATLLRQKLSIPRAWLAYGIRSSETMNRHVKSQSGGSKNEYRRVFHPIDDWSLGLVMENIRKSGVLLPEDYRFCDRSFHTPEKWILPLRRLSEMYPDDMRRIEAMFPLARAAIARNEFRKIKRKLKNVYAK